MTTKHERLEAAVAALAPIQLSDLAACGSLAASSVHSALGALQFALSKAGPELKDGWFTAAEISTLQYGRKLDAIKSVRERTSLGLAEANTYVTEHGSAYLAPAEAKPPT